MTTSKKKKKSARERRVLVASIICAGLIVAGSTFAWFTSTDEVTNRLTATADYGVSIVEDFKPPEDITPGQNVNKDVSAVNTGNVDAFVRLALENQLTITTYDKSDFSFGAFTDTTKTYYKTKKTTTSIGTQEYDTETAANNAITDTTTQTAVEISGKYYIKTETVVTLPKRYATATERDGELTALDASTPDIGTANTPGSTIYVYAADTEEVVNSIKTVTVTPPSDISKAVELSTTETLNSETGELTANEVSTLQAGGVLVMAASQILPAEQQYVVSGDDTTPPSKDDYSGSGQFTPNGDGLYIFKRTVYSGNGNDETEFSGYYYSSGKFYALKTKSTKNGISSSTTPYIDFGTVSNTSTANKGFTLDSDGQITGIEGTVSLLTKEEYKTADMGGTAPNLATITTSFGKLTETANTADTWNVATGTLDKSNVNAVKLTIKAPSTATTDSDVVIYVKLADDWSDYWQIVEPAPTTADVADWFYYKDTIKAGETTEKLVDYVRLANTVGVGDFVDLTYDLNAVLESVQVTVNNEGDQTADAVVAPWAAPTLTTTPVDNNGDVSKITAIEWATRP